MSNIFFSFFFLAGLLWFRETFEHKPRSSRKIPTTPDPYKDLGKRWVEKEFSDIHSHSDRLESRKRNEVIKRFVYNFFSAFWQL